jgi:mannose-6-phosphate isomerase-like protein (cupin superfamily)
MRYPPPRYLAEHPEASATLRRAGAPPDLEYPSGGTVDYLASGASTDGLFGLYRWHMAAAPSGPGPHFHRTMAEAFYVLTGTVRIYDGVEWRECEPGDFVHVPPGGIHGFRNEAGPASMLIHFAPGAPREGYFEGLAAWARDGRPSDEIAARFYEEHDNLFF